MSVVGRRRRPVVLSQATRDELSDDQLVALRSERWDEVHHLDDLDRRSLVLVVTGATAILLAQPNFVSSFARLQAFIAVLSAILCIGAIYSSARNRVTMIYAIWTIDVIDQAFDKRMPGLFAYSGNRRAPRSLMDFCKGLMFSIRGAITLFFSVVFGYSMYLVIWPLTRQWPSGGAGVALAAVLAICIAPCLTMWCLIDNWRRSRSVFEAINSVSLRSAATR